MSASKLSCIANRRNPWSHKRCRPPRRIGRVHAARALAHCESGVERECAVLAGDDVGQFAAADATQRADGPMCFQTRRERLRARTGTGAARPSVPVSSGYRTCACTSGSARDESPIMKWPSQHPCDAEGSRRRTCNAGTAWKMGANGSPCHSMWMGERTSAPRAHNDALIKMQKIEP